MPTQTEQMHTHGSYIEEKGTAILWHYGDAEPEFGAMQVRVFVVVIAVSLYIRSPALFGSRCVGSGRYRWR